MKLFPAANEDQWTMIADERWKLQVSLNRFLNGRTHEKIR
jgi:hypothetical protein